MNVAAKRTKLIRFKINQFRNSNEMEAVACICSCLCDTLILFVRIYISYRVKKHNTTHQHKHELNYPIYSRVAKYVQSNIILYMRCSLLAHIVFVRLSFHSLSLTHTVTHTHNHSITHSLSHSFSPFFYILQFQHVRYNTEMSKRA